MRTSTVIFAVAAHVALGTCAGKAKVWPGWKGITHMVTFGSSYTYTGFSISGAQPSIANPMGNPAYASVSDCNGPNWVEFLTYSYNATFLETINLAARGATVDEAVIPSPNPGVASLKDQVNQKFIPNYGKRPSYFKWASSNTLFASMMGMNDIGAVYTDTNASAVLAQSIASYASILDVLYQHGARNFLLITVPPINRSPLTTSKGPAAQQLDASAIAAYNANITTMAANLSSTYADATTFVFDFNNLFTQVLNNPCSYPETCAYLNTTNYCVDYENGTASWYTFLPECGIPVDEYLWLNSVHPTFRMMNATAKAIAAQLSH